MTLCAPRQVHDNNVTILKWTKRPFKRKVDNMMSAKLRQFSSTRAKQCFGQILLASASAPVAIEKHGKVTAILTSPEFFERAQAASGASTSRVLARITQASVEKDRLIRHQRIALDLVLLPSNETSRLICNAMSIVNRWRNERLCSKDYIERWEEILRLQPKEMAEAIVSDMDGWGPSLRQNSPWVGLHA
ncbi:prevent-host-death protein (plasmid) [Polaromonas naphthalenivorans CJ2]|uniref:Prevent-host-death protein n=2 Tax=Polaromonas naphthalenivorans TaxID=216465 RepID=A1VW33_POLNA|nr:prevent-host-death protein [Polaromonas naphthalenivorans CJ2]